MQLYPGGWGPGHVITSYPASPTQTATCSRSPASLETTSTEGAEVAAPARLRGRLARVTR